jgi:cephalosporin hydroxylase
MAADRNSDDGQGVMSRQQMDEIMRLANILYFRTKVWDNTYWMGVKTAKCPMDMWMYQEWMAASRPDVIIETGTFVGGSALFFAQVMDMLGHGKVITVDIEKFHTLPEHPRIEYLVGPSTDPATVERVRQGVGDARNVMVILDSDHHAPYKLEEMRVYGAFVSRGNYMIVEDSCFDEYPAWPEFGPGPAAAIRQYLAENDDFRIDRSMEKHIISFAPKGFLKKVG